MSRASVIVSLLIAAGLTAVSLITLRPQSGAGAQRQRVLELDPAAVESLSVAHGGAESLVERGRLPGQWLARSGEGAWPIAPERMRAALRVLAELRGTPAQEALPEGAATLTLQRQGAAPLTLRIAPPGLGGRRLVEVAGQREGGGQVFEIDDWLHEAMVTSGPREWRARSAMPGIGPEASRIAITSGELRIALNRAGAGWAMTAPVGARASGPAVDGLLGLLARAGVVRFYDEPPGDDVTGLDEPLATVRVDREIQIPEGASIRRITETVTLDIGGPTDTTMTSLFARVSIESTLEGAARGEAILAVSHEEFDRINPNPQAYISPQSAGVPASEVGAVALARAGSMDPAVVIERTAAGWEVAAGSAEGPAGAGEPVPLSEADSAALGEALQALCQAPAWAILIEPPEGYQPMLSVELRSLGGAPLEIIEIGDMPAPEGAGVGKLFVTRTAQTYRVYESRALAALNLLVGFVEAAETPALEFPAETGDGA